MANSLSGSTVDGIIADSSQSIEAVHAQTIELLLDGGNATDRWLIRWSDWCSPILVKETRQALKSRQFTWTLLLLMLAIVGWTFFAIISMMPGIYFFPAGKSLLFGYLFLLLVPTIIIVPNAAFHSLAFELQHGTFDVLSISPLTPMKIVSGKLAVAMVQSLIYFSAIAPCIALTYLLRGVPISTIAITLGWVALMSLVCASVGLLLASVNRVGAYSTVLSVALILITLGCAGILLTTLGSAIGYSSSMPIEAGIVMLIIMSVIATYSWLMILAASASIGIAGENYSTTIRWWVLMQSTFIVVSFVVGMLLVIAADFQNFDQFFTKEPWIASPIHPCDPLGRDWHVLDRRERIGESESPAFIARYVAVAAIFYLDQSWQRNRLYLCVKFLCGHRGHATLWHRRALAFGRRLFRTPSLCIYLPGAHDGLSWGNSFAGFAGASEPRRRE